MTFTEAVQAVSAKLEGQEPELPLIVATTFKTMREATGKDPHHQVVWPVARAVKRKLRLLSVARPGSSSTGEAPKDPGNRESG